MAATQNRNRNRKLEELSHKSQTPIPVISNAARLASGKNKIKQPYVQHFRSSPEPNPDQVNYATCTAARGPGNRRKGIRKPIAKFTETLVNGPSQLTDVQYDRDLSILKLVGFESVGGNNFEVAKGEDGEGGEEEEGGAVGSAYDGRFDDPVTECPSPASSVGRESPLSNRKINPPVPHISNFASKTRSICLSNNEGILNNGRDFDSEASVSSPLDSGREQPYLDGIPSSEEIATDIDDSDQSFYSCPGTPPLVGHMEWENGQEILPISDVGVPLRRISRSHRVMYPSSGSGPIQQSSSLRQSLSTYSGKRPLLSSSHISSSHSGLGTRKFHSPQISATEPPGDFAKQINSSFCSTIYSAESSFNTSSSFSYNAEKDCSPSTSPDSSFDTEDVKKVPCAIRQRGPEIAPLAVVAEGSDSPSFSGDIESPYNGDWDGEITDIDDSDVNRKPRCKRPASITTPSKAPSLPRCIKKQNSLTQRPNNRKIRQAHTEGQAVERDEEAAFQRLAEAFFGDELEPNSGSSLALGDIATSKVSNIYHLDRQASGFDEEAPAAASRDTAVADIRDNISSGPAPTGRVPEQLDDEDEFGTIDTSFEVELSNNRALGDTAHPLHTLHFSLQYEVTRVALNAGLYRNSDICAHIYGYCDDLYEAEEYCEIWKTLTQFSGAAVKLEWTHESVWRNFKEGRGWPDNIYMTGRVYYGETPKEQEKSSEKLPLVIKLNPLRRTTGNRFFNRFGSDRFLTLRLPPLANQPGVPKDVLQKRRERIVEWLADEEIHLMNRKWKCFFVKDDKSKRKSDEGKGLITEYFSQAIFFATEGVGIGDSLDDIEQGALGFKPSGNKLRKAMTVEDLLKWHIPLNGNLGMTVSKFWSRISLGLSNSTPTVTFEPSQIEFVGDVKSRTGEVMNDGCSVASPAVMKMVRQKLGLKATPTAVQARLGGAKGVWMVDPVVDWNSEAVYIKVTASQLKYKGYDNDDDWARITLDVLTASHDPIPATINTQYIPILEDRGVPFKALKEILEEHLERDLEELFQIIDKPAELRRWIYNRENVGNERMSAKSIPTLGALPANRSEIAIMLLESGFLVEECNFLMTQVRKMIDQYCDDLKTKLHIKIPNSTTLLCVADPTGTLREGEVSLRFSSGVLDPKTMRRNPVIIGDILVARNPAHLPSDIQRVRAVDIQSYHSPGLRELQDVIVFSVQGDRSLASLLSGGDYDGDKPWVCWDQRLVEPFQNSPSTFDEYGKRVQRHFDKSAATMIDLQPDRPGFFNRFFRAGISNSLQENFLGHCTSVWEKHCYHQNSISNPMSIELAKLCSLLVDAPKQGLSILSLKRDEITWLGYRYPKPAYKEPGSRSSGVHVIDRLHFDVAGQKVMERQKAFHEGFGDSPSYDPLITAIYNREDTLAMKKGPGKPMSLALKHLIKELQSLAADWRECSRDGADGFKAGVSRFYQRYRGIRPPEELSQDPAINRWASEGDSHFSHWGLLRASAAFYKWGGQRGLVWYMAGREVCFIKSHGTEMENSNFGPRTLVEGMYIPLKTSGNFRITKAVATEGEEDKEGEYV